MRTPRIILLNPDCFPIAAHCYVNADDVGGNIWVELVGKNMIRESILFRIVFSDVVDTATF